MVEELFPAFVSVVAEMDVDERVVPGLDGLFDEFHAGIFQGFAAFFDIFYASKLACKFLDGVGSFRQRRRMGLLFASG